MQKQPKDWRCYSPSCHNSRVLYGSGPLAGQLTCPPECIYFKWLCEGARLDALAKKKEEAASR